MLRSKMTGKDFLRDYLLSLVLELVILFGLMAFCSLFISRGSLIQAPELVGHEMSSPTVGRFIYMILSFLLAAGLSITASRFVKAEKDVPAFWCGYAAGIFLWQAIGEEAWHFSVGGMHFVQLESISSFPLVLVFIAFLIYCVRHESLDWGVWITVVSFACNWLGHYVTVGIYPFAQGLVASRTWNVCMGSICGGLVFAASLVYLLLRGRTRKDRMFASILTYIAIGITALSMIDG